MTPLGSKPAPVGLVRVMRNLAADVAAGKVVPGRERFFWNDGGSPCCAIGHLASRVGMGTVDGALTVESWIPRDNRNLIVSANDGGGLLRNDCNDSQRLADISKALNDAADRIEKDLAP